MANNSSANFCIEGRIGRIVLNRPQILNALAQPDVERLAEVVAEAEGREDLRIITLEGSGSSFSTGIDLKALSAGSIDMGAYARPFDYALRSLETMDKLVICMMHGYTLGGGLQLALAADIRITTPEAKLGLPAIKEGLVPSMSTFRLPRYIGLGRAKRMILLGDIIDGVEAQRIGLAEHIIPEDRREVDFLKIVDQYMKINSKGARLSKQALLDCFDQDFDQFVVRNFDRLEQAQKSADFVEAMAAYREKRDPSWN
jgi:enoyl-CoA hydratase/carnithine racemase